MLGMEIMRSGGPPLGPEFINGQAQPPRNVRLDARGGHGPGDNPGNCGLIYPQSAGDVDLRQPSLDHERLSTSSVFLRFASHELYHLRTLYTQYAAIVKRIIAGCVALMRYSTS